MPRASLNAVLLSVIALTACSSTPSKPKESCDCTTIVCGSLCGNVCAVCPNDGVCAADGMSCTPALPIGAACSTDIECGENRKCLSPTNGVQAPNGYCSEPCNANAPCPSGSTCGLDIKGDSVCLADCGASGPSCRTSDGYTCSSSGTCTACVGDCTNKACGDDGCGNQCGITQPMTPACNAAGEVCESNQCAGGFDVTDELTAPYKDGLWDAAALSEDLNGVGILVGGREVAQYTGGQIESRGITAVEIYTPGAAQPLAGWPAPLPEPIARPHAAYFSTTTFGPTIVVAGGIDDPDVLMAPDTPAQDVLVYDTMNDNWKGSGASEGSVLGPMPDPSMGGGLAQLGSLLYLIVGELTDGSVSTAVHSYDPVADAWDTPSQPPARPSARSYVGVVSDGNFIYVIGGWDNTTMSPVGTVEVFSPSTGWTITQSLVVPTTDPKVAIASGRVFVFGGRVGPSQSASTVPYVQSIDLSTHDTLLLGETYEQLSGQAPVSLQQGPFILVGALEFTPGTTYPTPDEDVLTFSVPSP